MGEKAAASSSRLEGEQQKKAAPLWTHAVEKSSGGTAKPTASRWIRTKKLIERDNETEKKKSMEIQPELRRAGKTLTRI
jgi:hypothetical protein